MATLRAASVIVLKVSHRKVTLQKDKARSDVTPCCCSRLLSPDDGLAIIDIVELPEHFVGAALVEPDASGDNADVFHALVDIVPDVLGRVMHIALVKAVLGCGA